MKPVFQIGKNGINDNFIDLIEKYIEKNEN